LQIRFIVSLNRAGAGFIPARARAQYREIEFSRMRPFLSPFLFFRFTFSFFLLYSPLDGGTAQRRPASGQWGGRIKKLSESCALCLRRVSITARGSVNSAASPA